MRSSRVVKERLAANANVAIQSWVESQHPPTQWNRAAGKAAMTKVHKIQTNMAVKKEKIPAACMTLCFIASYRTLEVFKLNV